MVDAKNFSVPVTAPPNVYRPSSLTRKSTLFHPSRSSAFAARTKLLPAVCFSRLSCASAFRRSSSKAGRGVAFLKLAAAKRRRWLVLGEFAKYAFFGLKRKRRDFERSVLKYVSIKIPALTHSGRKSRVCVNAADRLSPEAKRQPLFVFFCLPATPHTRFRLFASLPFLVCLPFLFFCLSPLVIKSGL